MITQEGNDNFKLKYLATEVEGQCILESVQTIILNKCKFAIFIIVSILLAGIPLLITHWYPILKRKLYYDFASLQQCTHVSIINYDGQTTICQIKKDEVIKDQITKITCFVFVNRYMKYIIDEKNVVRALLFDEKARIQRIASAKIQTGLNQGQVSMIRNCYGIGTMEIQQPKWYILVIHQIVRPLYLFLFYSVGLWIYQQYYYYSGIIFATSIFAISITVYQELTVNTKIHGMAFNEVKINSLRNGSVVQLSSLDLVPGDIVFLKQQIKIPFQGIILEGSALINQCALTGESVPVVKKADVRENYINPQTKIDKSAYVYEGTTIIQVNNKKKMAQFQSTRQAYGIPVCVIRTNFVTMKGQLIRIILFPKQQLNIFQKQSAKFLIFLFCIALVTFLGMIAQLQKIMTPVDILVTFLDLIAITVPPALPVSMAIGILFAVDKLKGKSIFCIEQNKVVMGGAVTFSCFDKTGTLTEDFMDFEALIPAEKGRFYDSIKNRQEKKTNVEETLKQKPYLFHIFNNMASNHSIIRIEETGEMIGDPMEIKLFQFGEFTLNQSNSDPQVIVSFESTRKQAGQVFRRFEFDSDLQRMSVVTRIGGNTLYSYAKGSPEMMATIMEKSSIPPNYNQILKEYTSNGFRVLAIGSKQIQGNDYKSISRQAAEAGLVFNGFQVFQNKLKPQTNGAIKELKEAKIGVVMITGDNPLTGANIGYKCGISFLQKGMIICDFKDGRYHIEQFVYNKDQNQSPSVDTDSKPVNNVSDPKNLQVNPSYLQIQIHTNERISDRANNNSVKNIPLQQRIQPTDNPQVYMKSIIELAHQTNCQLCVTGNAFNHLFEGKVEEISPLKQQFLECTTVYARTKPNDKAKIVMVYQHTGRTVSMCGDGANDCGALKQADIGLSLSQAQASISAPFTSQIANISSMVELLKECRAGLATNFSLFNIMASYSLTQYCSTAISKVFYCYPSQFQYMYWDIGCNFFFIIFVGYTATAQRLSVQIPSNSLFCFTNLFQIIFAFALNVVGQISMILSLSGIWSDTIDYPNVGGFDVELQYYSDNQEVNSEGPQTSILFLFANFMYLGTLIAFSIGKPWRRSFYTNIYFMIALLIITTYSVLLCVAPVTRWSQFLINYMDDSKMTGFILGIALGFAFTIILLQKLVWEPMTIWLKRTYPSKKWL